MREKDFEDILERYPDLIEPGLKPIGRQVVIYNRRHCTSSWALFQYGSPILAQPADALRYGSSTGKPG